MINYTIEELQEKYKDFDYLFEHDYYGKTLARFDNSCIKDYYGSIQYRIDGFLSRRELMAILAILYSV